MAKSDLGKELIDRADQLRAQGEPDVASVLYTLGASIIEGHESVAQLATLCANLCNMREAVARVPPSSLPALRQNAEFN